MKLSPKKISELEQERRKKFEDVEVLTERLFSVWMGTGFFAFPFLKRRLPWLLLMQVLGTCPFAGACGSEKVVATHQ
jgi:hypothetical protein